MLRQVDIVDMTQQPTTCYCWDQLDQNMERDFSKPLSAEFLGVCYLEGNQIGDLNPVVVQ
jgi:hypothetical protein